MRPLRRHRLRNARPRTFRGGFAAALVVCLLAGATASATVLSGGTHAATAAAPRILFGLGPTAEGARKGALAASAPLGMLTTWFNGHGDLSWMSGWKNTEIGRDYAAGYAMHLVVWSGASQTKIQTRYGEACGQAYPLSGEFLEDMSQLARIWAPPRGKRLFVTLMTEFQTYACRGNEWSAEPATTAYFEALKDQYRAALAIFHQQAPGSEVSLGWGGWQARWNNPAVGGGRSLFKHFADVMKQSDFESFEVINSSTPASDIGAMTRTLSAYGPVMLAYFQPNEDETRASVLQHVLSRSFLAQLAGERLFSLSFMNERFMANEPTSFTIVRNAIRRYECNTCGP
jgi:hypothetical protein